MAEKHEHLWEWIHAIIDGVEPGESRVVRRCSECGLKQMAIIPARAWKKATGDYALDEHYQS